MSNSLYQNLSVKRILIGIGILPAILIAGIMIIVLITERMALGSMFSGNYESDYLVIAFSLFFGPTLVFTILYAYRMIIAAIAAAPPGGTKPGEVLEQTWISYKIFMAKLYVVHSLLFSIVYILSELFPNRPLGPTVTAVMIACIAIIAITEVTGIKTKLLGPVGYSIALAVITIALLSFIFPGLWESIKEFTDSSKDVSPFASEATNAGKLNGLLTLVLILIAITISTLAYTKKFLFAGVSSIVLIAFVLFRSEIVSTLGSVSIDFDPIKTFWCIVVIALVSIPLLNSYRKKK